MARVPMEYGESYRILKTSSASNTYTIAQKLTELQSTYNALSDEQKLRTFLNPQDNILLQVLDISEGAYSAARINPSGTNCYIEVYKIVSAKAFRSTNGGTPSEITSQQTNYAISLCILD